jgi:hypothetical protein
VFCHPSGYSLADLKANIPDLSSMRQLRRTQNHIATGGIGQEDETRVTSGDFGHDVNKFKQHSIQAGFGTYDSADAMKNVKLRQLWVP